MPTRYYKLRGRKISIREYWRICTDPLTFAIAVLAKPFGGIVPAWSVPLIDRLPIVRPGELPQRIAGVLNRHSEEFEERGFRLLYYLEAPLLEDNRIIASSILLSEDARTIGQVVYIRNDQNVTISMTVGCVSEDGSYSAVTNRKQELDNPPTNDRIIRYSRTNVAGLLSRYREHLDEWEAEGLRRVKLNEHQVEQLFLRIDRQVVEYHISRGVLVPMTPEELRRHGVRE